jgi:hypothetical protein
LAAEAARIDQRSEEVWGGLEAMALLPQHGLLLLGFPLDRAMHDLRRMVRPSKVRSLIAATCPQVIPADLRFSKSRSSFTLVRYKPERRAVLHWRIGCVAADGRQHSEVPVWLRCHAEPTVARTALATAAAAAAGIACPRTLGIAHDRLALESHVAGRAWTGAITAHECAADLAAAATTVAHLHRSAPPAGLPFLGPVHELDRVLRAAEDIARLSPALGDHARARADQLAACVPANGPVVFAHGDLHRGQVMLTDPGAALVDFDRACVSSPAHDLASLHAHCTAASPDHGAPFVAEFLRAYGRHVALPSIDELAWWTSAALLRAATQPFRALRADWPARTRWLLDAAEHALGTTAGEGA